MFIYFIRYHYNIGNILKQQAKFEKSFIGIFFENKGNYSEALEYFQKSLSILKETLPENHPNIQSLDAFIKAIQSNNNKQTKQQQQITIKNHLYVF